MQHSRGNVLHAFLIALKKLLTNWRGLQFEWLCLSSRILSQVSECQKQLLLFFFERCKKRLFKCNSSVSTWLGDLGKIISLFFWDQSIVALYSGWVSTCRKRSQLVRKCVFSKTKGCIGKLLMWVLWYSFVFALSCCHICVWWIMGGGFAFLAVGPYSPRTSCSEFLFVFSCDFCSCGQYTALTLLPHAFSLLLIKTSSLLIL